ncbi:unnamed protein product [Urochloa humidicola]
MAKRKKHEPATEPLKNPDLAAHYHPTTTSSTPERNCRPPPLDPAPSTTAGSDSDPAPPSSPRSVRSLIEPYSKPRLAAILAESAAADPALCARLAAAADASPSHRRLFIHGLPPRASSAALSDAFSRFGPISDSHAVAAGPGRHCRGYGFVTFASRAAARSALRDAPRLTVAGRPVSAQYASAGPSSGRGGGAGRRVYVTNVAPDAGGAAERLRAFFAGFGELEGGPFGFDGETDRSRGYALFVYRAAAGAAAAVAEPYRVFEGRTLRCQLADEPKRKAKEPPAPPEAAVVAAPGAGTPRPALQPVLDAIAAAGVGELATCARDPAKAAALLGKNPALAAAALSCALAAAAAPNPAAASAIMPVAVATARPATAAAAKAMPVKLGVQPSGSAGLLGPYKPPSSSPVVVSSSPGTGRKGTMLGWSW